MPSVGDLFIDTRGGDRTMRVSYHGDRGTVVVSLWLGTVCRGSFRMATDDVRRLVSTLNEIDRTAAVPVAPVGAGPVDSGPGVTGTATVDAAGPADPPVDETGDISGIARMVAAPTLRVA
ncbi:hypothetical protein Pen02_31600 [Plantactinospora endophytica]|uniref:DUF1508 domain-containing protein n=2 Tax=Plantactinospora endophytica TaxID=673535 RepID=A0ABQ4E0H5_9ACTN|nr:hypothetical protein Pen02_31600 [Plantactinospora endophytica]